MKNISKHKWFQLSSRLRLSPFPNVNSMEAVTFLMKKVVGQAFKVTLLLFKGNAFWAFFDENDYKRVGKFIFRRVKNNPLIFKKLVRKQKVLENKFLNWLKNLNKKNLTKFSNQEIGNLHSHYLKEYRLIYANYFPILAVERPFIEYLRNILGSL